MKFSIIGSGNIAWFFGKRIAAAGHKCVGVYGRNEVAAKELADALLSGRCGNISELRDGDADVCFLAVSDSAISKVAPMLSLKQTILVHMAGAMEMDIIKNAASDCAVLWPVYSITRLNPPAHREIPIAWEASSDRAKKYVLEMAHAVTDNLFEAKNDQRKWLHLSAVMTNNFINHLLAINEKICVEHNVPVSALQPLIHQTFERIKQSSPSSLQTGPAIRGDEATINQHITLLEKYPPIQKVYESLTKSIQAMDEAVKIKGKPKKGEAEKS